MTSILYLNKEVKQSSRIRLGLNKLISESLVYDDRDSFLADAFSGELESDDKYYIDTYDNYKSSLDLINKLRTYRVRCYICFDGLEQIGEAFKSIKPKKLYEYVERRVNGTDHIYEVTSKSDWRFSPFFMSYGDSNIEDYYQLWIKGYGFLGYESWREVKGRPPINWIPVNEAWNRDQVAEDKDYLYIFTDNLNRSSGFRRHDKDHNVINEVDLNSHYFIKYGKEGQSLSYPYQSQAVIRGLANAYPITTMKNQYKHQLTDVNQMTEVWQNEIMDIRFALRTGNYKGVKFSSSIFGRGTYSKLSDELKSVLDDKLASIGIDNMHEAARPIVNMTLDQVYKEYFERCPELLFELANIGLTMKFYDRFYSGPNSQAVVYCRLLNKLFKLE